MMRKCVLILSLFLVALVPVLTLGTGAGFAEERGRDGGAVRLLTTVPVPGSGMYVFDISWVDAGTQLFYLADRSNAAIDVVDARRGLFVRQIKGGFAGAKPGANGNVNNNISGPNGVLVSGNWLFVTDAPSRVVTIDLRTDTIVSTVSVGGADSLRTDEMAYDPKDGILLVVNNADEPPFATLITVNKATGQLTLGTQIKFPTATNGAEQPVWDPRSGKFYLSIPEVNGDGGTGPDGAIARINPHTGAVEAMFPVKLCQPAGLTLGPRQDLLIGCSVVFDSAGGVWDPAGSKSAAPSQVIMDARTGSIDKVVEGVGGSDEVWFNRGDGRYYTGSRNSPGGPVLGVIDAESQSLLQVVPTVNVPFVKGVHFSGTAHSVAVNPHNNHVLVPLSANNVVPNCLTGCIAIYGTPRGDRDDDD
jgi:hypothetical protein